MASAELTVSPVALAEDMLQVPAFYDPDLRHTALTAPETLTPDQVGDERLLLYRAALREVAQARREDRMFAKDAGDAGFQLTDFSNETWRPSAEKVEEIRAKLEPHAARLAMINNFERSVAEGPDPYLRTSQDDVKKSFLAYLRGGRTGQQDPHGFQKSGRIVWPTGGGKTAMASRIAEAAGVGQPVSEQRSERIRALVVTSRLRLVKDYIGENGLSGFGKFAKGLLVTQITGSKKRFEGDAVTVPYQLFAKAVEKNWIDGHDFQLRMYDEGHNVLGRKALAARQKLNEQAPGVDVALTATPMYNSRRTIYESFPHDIATMDFRTGIDTGEINGVQLIGLATGIKAPEKEGRHDYTEQELAPLRKDKERNAQIVAAAKHFVSTGRRTFVTTIAGDKCWHARYLAAATAEEKILDPKSGALRPIRAAAIGNFQKDTDNDKAIDDFNKGKLDVLFEGKLADEGIDLNADAVILTDLTNSPLKRYQQVGRGARADLARPLTLIAEFLDNCNTARATAWGVVGEEEIQQGLILGGNLSADVVRQLKARQSPGPRPNSFQNGPGQSGPDFTERDILPEALDLHMLPPKLSAMVAAVELNPVKVLTIKPGEYGYPAETLPTLIDVTATYCSDISSQAMKRLLESKGFKLPTKLAPGHGFQYLVPKNAIEFLDTYEFPEPAKEGEMSASEIAAYAGWGTFAVNKTISDIEEYFHFDTVERRSRGRNHVRPHYNPDQIALIVEYLEKELAPPVSEDDVRLANFSKEIDTHPNQIVTYLAEKLDRLPYNRSDENKRKIRCLSKEDERLAREKFAPHTLEAAETASAEIPPGEQAASQGSAKAETQQEQKREEQLDATQTTSTATARETPQGKGNPRNQPVVSQGTATRADAAKRKRRERSDALAAWEKIADLPAKVNCLPHTVPFLTERFGDAASVRVRPGHNDMEMHPDVSAEISLFAAERPVAGPGWVSMASIMDMSGSRPSAIRIAMRRLGINGTQTDIFKDPDRPGKPLDVFILEDASYSLLEDLIKE